MTPRYLILGSSGFLGYHLARHLLDKGHAVGGVDLGKSLIDSPHYEHANFDTSNLAKLTDAMREGDIVIDAASSIKPNDAKRGKRAFLEAVVKGGNTLAEAAKAKGAAKVLYVSTAGEMYGNVDAPASEDAENPITAYGYGKLAAELVLREALAGSAVACVAARVSNPFGNKRTRSHGFVDVAINKALAGERVEIWGTDQIVRDYLFIQDVSIALTLLASRSCQHGSYNVCSGHYYSLADIVALIDAGLGERKLDCVVVPSATQEIVSSRPDPRRMSAEFEWRPVLSLKDYVRYRLAEKR